MYHHGKLTFEQLKNALEGKTIESFGFDGKHYILHLDTGGNLMFEAKVLHVAIPLDEAEQELNIQQIEGKEMDLTLTNENCMFLQNLNADIAKKFK